MSSGESEMLNSEVIEESMEDRKKRKNREYKARSRAKRSDEKKEEDNEKSRDYLRTRRKDRSDAKKEEEKQQDRDRQKERRKDNEKRLAGIDATKKWKSKNPGLVKEYNDRYHQQHPKHGFVKYNRERKLSPVSIEVLRSSSKLPPKIQEDFNENMKRLVGHRSRTEIVYFGVVLPNQHPNPPHISINTPTRVREFLQEFPNVTYAYYIGIGRGRGLYILFSNGRHWRAPNDSSLAQIATWYNYTPWLIRIARVSSRNEVGVDRVTRGQQAEAWFQYVAETSFAYKSNWMPLNLKIETSKFLSIELKERESAHRHAATGFPFVCVKPKCKNNHSPDELGTNGPPFKTTIHPNEMRIQRFKTGICTITNYALVKDFLTVNKIRRKLVGEVAKKGDKDKGYKFDPKTLPPVEKYNTKLDEPFSDEGGDSFDDPDDSNDHLLDEDEGPSDDEDGSDDADDEDSDGRGGDGRGGDGGGGKLRKDPNAPSSAYFWFCNDQRPKIKGANPKKSVGEIGKLLGQSWGEAGPALKNKYQGMADRDNARYEREMAAYKKSGKAPAKGRMPVQQQDDDYDGDEEYDEFTSGYSEDDNDTDTTSDCDESSDEFEPPKTAPAKKAPTSAKAKKESSSDEDEPPKKRATRSSTRKPEDLKDIETEKK